MRKTRLAWLLMFGVVVGTVALGPSAAAHGDLVRSVPSAGSSLAKVPNHVKMTFGEPPTSDIKVTVLDPCGEDLVKQIFVDSKLAHVYLKRGSPGRWRVTYRVISKVDGHPERGAFGFEVDGTEKCGDDPEPRQTASPPPVVGPGLGEDSSPNRAPLYIAVGGGILVLLAVVLRIATSRT
ncbi:MAG: copper resistance protein CopC [Actinomycetota bacterium]|nr:copper resistance protein CopC [Actinomycetota bacterium]